jgi:hypothetical protein
VEFATKYGDDARNEAFGRIGLPGVEVVTVGRNLTGDAGYLKGRLAVTDVLVDATARRDPSAPIVPNAWIAILPDHAVICDLAVDPYLLDNQPPIVRGIERIPQGNLDQWEFAPNDPAWDTLPPSIPTGERRTVVSCYSWPGVRPEPCMHVYGSQLAPLLERLVSPVAWTASGPMGRTSSRHLRAEASAIGTSHQDRWHQSARTESVPDSPRLIAGRSGGAPEPRAPRRPRRSVEHRS